LIEVILRFGSALKFGNSAMSDFSGKRVVITGAGRGIGLAIAQAFAARGAKVAVISRNETSCGAAAKAINAEYPESARFYGLDVSDFDAVQECGKKVLEDFGGVDILVNNAGVTRDGLILRMKSEDWDTVLDTNLKGAFNLVKAFQRSLMKSDAPRIINISSVIGLIGNAGQANYAASKAGLIGFTKSVARELAGRKVTCNAIAPGFITTDMTDELPEAIKEDIVKRVPLSDFGQVDDIANAVLFLAGPEARYITGQVLAVDGGMTM
jgi:3-oxoacyl-[acyl-carrier protein] reductase